MRIIEWDADDKGGILEIEKQFRGFEAMVLFGMLSLLAQFAYWARIVSGLSHEHV